LRHTNTILAFLVVLALVGEPQAQGTGSLYDLDLEALSKLKVSSGAVLTKTEAGKVPASVTTITRRMVAESGARSIDELLEVFVPNFYRLRQATSPDFGLRGIIHSRDNKTLMLVNGRIMNHRMLLGVVSERFLPLLGDIESIEVVRGPGSAVYGPGAINGVISIHTLSDEVRSGIQANVVRGYIEGHTLGEVRLQRALGSRADISAYYGIDAYRGSEPAHSPLVYSRSRSFGKNKLFVAGVPVDSGIVHDNRAMDDRPHQKAHVHLRYGGTQLWGRLVRGSTQFLPARSTIESRRTFDGSSMALMYDQRTIQAEQRLEVGRSIELQARASYDTNDLIRQNPGNPPAGREYTLAMRERELNLRQLATWSPHRAHSMAIGVEHSWEWFGEDPSTLTEDAAHSHGRVFDPWSTQATGILGEYQWNANACWTAFLGGRADRHSFTEWMYSPKAAIVFSPADRYVAKLLYNQSVRRSEDLELKDQNEAELLGDTEKINSLELRQDLHFGESLTLSCAGLWYRFDSISWVAGQGAKPVGRSEVAGLEAELSYRSPSHSVAASYSLTKMLDYSLADSTIRKQLESSAPYGYGNDLQHWPRHNGKLVWRWQHTRRLATLSSLRLFWGYQGAQDYAEYNNEVLRLNSSSRTDDGRTDAFDGSAFLDVALQLSVGRGFLMSAHVHGALGWVAKDLNKRNFYGRMAGYRAEAPAVSVRIGYAY